MRKLYSNIVAGDLPIGHKKVTISKIIRYWAKLDASRPAINSLTPDGASIEQTLSRQELDTLSDHIASSLLEAGVQPNDPVLLCATRTPEMIAAMIGILRAGGVYVPIDPDYPSKRIKQMIDVLGGRPASIADNIGSMVLQDHQTDIIDLKQAVSYKSGALDRESKRGPEDAAYVMFTSGSTGIPKGVTVPQRAILRLVLDADFTTISKDTVSLQLAPIAFDASTLEIWGPLLNGGILTLYPGETTPDLDVLQTVLTTHGITMLWLTSSLFNLIVDCRVGMLRDIPELLVGGEALSVPHIATAMKHLPDTQLINGYGPTENTTFTCCHRIPRNFDRHDPDGIPIGQAISGTTILVCDDRGRAVPDGEEGELIACGEGVALGYWGRDDLTNEHFPSNSDHHTKEAIERRCYRTGDRVRIGPDNLVRFLGRIDDQIKIDGHRIELGEIQTLLREQLEVRDAITLVQDDQYGNRRIISYVEVSTKIDESALRDRLSATLPAAAVPSRIIILDALPLSPNGKVDRRALTATDQTQAFTAQDMSSEIEQKIQQLWCRILDVKSIGRHDDFFQLGGTSMLALRFIEKWRSKGNTPIPIARMYAGASSSRIAEFVVENTAHTNSTFPTQTAISDEKIAIIGMAGRFPGANSVEALWEMLMNGGEGTSFFSDDTLDHSVSEADRNDSCYVKARGILPDIEGFDCHRFKLTPREAELLDPQQRLLLEIAWDTLESAGCDPERYPGTIGIWAGTRSGDYLQQLLQTRPDVVERSGIFQVTLANDKDFAANRVAYLLGLTGPAIAVYSACSTSLVAVHEATRGLINQECDLALAGAAAVTIPQRVGHMHQKGNILSTDGRCRPFDANASGTFFSDGVAMVALKRLSDAQRDGDQIHAVILASSVNNDGGDKASFMAPSPEGQFRVVADAIQRASISVNSIGFVETHGTATPLGDPVEVDGLLRAFGHAEKPTCVIGSIKSNIGHLTAAAGVAGLIKATLSVRNGIIPPTLHFKQANPLLDLGGRFLVSASVESFRPGGPRRAGVSSFGVGGTNAHVILEQPPNRQTVTDPGLLRTPLLCISAPDIEALDELQSKLADHLDEACSTSIEDIAWSLRSTRHHWHMRRAVSGMDHDECISALRAQSSKSRVSTGEALPDPRTPIFVFPGQSSQYSGMGRGLAMREPLFAKHLESCAQALGTFDKGMTLQSLLNPELTNEVLASTKYAQPALFAVEYALARTWMDLGVQPAWMLGHSVGEFVAACLSGIFTLEDALHLVAARGAIMDRMPHGEMLSIRASTASLSIPEDLDLAAVNGSALCVVSGTADAIGEYASSLDKFGILNKRLLTSHAFHSRLMEPAVAEFREIVEATPKHSQLAIPILSTVTGKPLTPELAANSDYWARHLRVPVHFANAVDALTKELPNELTWFECGPGSGAIASMVRASLPGSRKRNDAFIQGLSLPGENKGTDVSRQETVSFASAVGAAWCAGHDVPSPQARGKYQQVPLPSTPFTRTRSWLLDTPQACQNTAGVSATSQSPLIINNESSPPLQSMDMNSFAPQKTTPNDIVIKLCNLLSDLSGQNLDPSEENNGFLELGFDSLLLTQAASTVRKKFGVDVSFRELNEDFTTPKQLAEHLASSGVKADPTATSSPSPASIQTTPQQAAYGSHPIIQNDVSRDLTIGTMQQQLLLMQQQLIAIQNPGSLNLQSVTQAQASATTNISVQKKPESKRTGSIKGHGPQLVINRAQGNRLTNRQKSHIDRLIKDYSQHTAESRKFTQKYRSTLADPRTVSGFTSRLKEIIYPIVISSSSGCHLVDIDGNKYVDMVSGFGSNFFGFGVPFVRKAVTKQMKQGMEIGPQTELVGEATSLFQRLVPSERVAFCNTGSEAVLASLRLARTVTGRDLVISFTGAYHGIFDEVIARPTPGGSRPAAPGIPQGAVDNTLILPWADPESIEKIRAHADDVAAVLVEPVQSRDPATQPKEFLQQLRTLTEEIGSALIFDEVVCGFRVAQGGAQEYFGIEADLGTYGKVVGGGVPIGIIAGKKKFMDALDGGFWRYGDDSKPTVGVTYFAGTFVRHPPALAAAIACMKHMLKQGPELQQSVDQKTNRLVEQLTDLFKHTAAPVNVAHFSSILRITANESIPHGEILYHHLRLRGVHIQDARPAFITAAHTQKDLDYIVSSFRDVIADLQAGGFFPERVSLIDSSSPPEPGAKLGRDPQGNPTWYVKDSSMPSGYCAFKDRRNSDE